MNARNFISLILLLTPYVTNAQLRLPSFDVALKGGYMFIPDDAVKATYETLLLHGEFNIHINQNIAIGYFHQRNSFITNYHSEDNSQADNPAAHLMQGVNLRLSTGRSSRWRPYLNVKYVFLEAVVHYNGFDVAYEGNAFAGGIGVMVRLSHNLYLNLVEAELIKISDPGEVLFMDRNNLFPQIRMGLTYNFSKRK